MQAFYSFTRHFSLEAGVKLSGFHSGSYIAFHILPSVILGWNKGYDAVKVHFSMYPQYFHQVGLAEIGISSNFWIGATKEVPAQLTLTTALGWNRKISESGWSVGIEPYFKRVLHQPEYRGSAFDMLVQDYSPYNHLSSANGFNTGVSITVSKMSGRLTGWGGYTLGIARRKFPEYKEYLPAASESLNTVNLFVSYLFNKSWRTSLNFVYATGRPVTPVKEIYMVGENVIVCYGKRNSSRLPDYMRIDLSATYSFNIKHADRIFPCYVNFSLINATGSRNIEVTYYKFSFHNLSYFKREIPTFFRFLPSISFTFDF